MVCLNGGWFHDVNCAVLWGIEKSRKSAAKQLAKQRKEKKKTDAEYKRKFYESDTKTRQKAAKLVCHAYIRERDKGLLCICCDEPLGEDFHAGHFLESGNNPAIRYDENNIHGQRIYCNKFKGGNSDNYEKKLRLKIGSAAVDELISLKGKSVKRTAEDYKAIEVYYKEKLAKLRESNDNLL